MRISVTDPVSQAIERTRTILFQPFQIEKWFTLGFCAFLANLAGGGNFNFGGGGSGGGGGGGGGHQGAEDDEPGPGELFGEAMEWIGEHLVEVIVGGICVFVVIVSLGMLLSWLSSRGKFMFLDGVAHNRGAVRQPWHEFRAEGNSLFWFQFFFPMAVMLFVVAILAACGLIALPDIQAEQFGTMAILAIVLGILFFLTTILVAGCIQLFLTQFVVPIMYVRRIGVMAAWSEFGRTIVTDHKGTLFLYLLFQIVLSVSIGILSVLAMCCTCCLVLIPYLGTVILLPLLVFERSYSVYFLQQFGPEWRIMRDDPATQADVIDAPR